MIQRLLIAAALLCITLLAACAPQGYIQAQPLNNSVPAAPNACLTVKCNAETHCVNGACVCNSGTKKCGEGCIAASKCCSNSECGAERYCSGGVCAQQPVCKFNEVWDDDSKECSCGETAKFCKEQNKCIPAKSCCWHNDCGTSGFLRCAATTYSADVCAKSDTKKCRLIHEGTKQVFSFSDQQEYTVKLQQVVEGGKFILNVNNVTTKALNINETATAANATVFVENLQIFGGYCREEPE